jgi:hypothetical protein
MAAETIPVVVGALTGGALSITSALLIHRLSGKRERKKMEFDQKSAEAKWHRDKLDEAYRNTLKHIIRLRNIGPITKNYSKIELNQEFPPEWLNDLSEARAWFSVFFLYCPDDFRDDVGPISADLFNLSNLIVGFEPGKSARAGFKGIIHNGVLDYQAFCDYINSIESAFANCAEDIIKSSRQAHNT